MAKSGHNVVTSPAITAQVIEYIRPELLDQPAIRERQTSTPGQLLAAVIEDHILSGPAVQAKADDYRTLLLNPDKATEVNAPGSHTSRLIRSDALRTRMSSLSREIAREGSSIVTLGDASPPPSSSSSKPELVFGLVRWIGASARPVLVALRSALESCGFDVVDVDPANLLDGVSEVLGLPEIAKSDPAWERYRIKMDAGDVARCIDRQLLAGLAIRRIGNDRKPPPDDRLGRAVIVKSLMHPDEVRLFKEVYGDSFIAVGITGHEEYRSNELIKRFQEEAVVDGIDLDQIVAGLIERDRGAKPAGISEDLPPPVQALVRRDQELTRATKGRTGREVAIQEVMPLCDYIIAMGPRLAADSLEEKVKRLVHAVLSDPFSVATVGEAALATASVQSMVTKDLGRRVGAVVLNRDGDLISVGVNDDPAAKGGLQSQRPGYATTKVASKVDSNFAEKQKMAAGIRKAILNAAASTSHATVTPDDLQAILETADIDKQLSDITEWGTSVHAEMAALLSAGRSGRSTQGGVLYCTTEPCHNCMRHIIAAGIARLVYYEPYPKTRWKDLHGDQVHDVSIDGPPPRDTNKVIIDQFEGFLPARLADFLSWKERKVTDTGLPVRWTEKGEMPWPRPRFSPEHAEEIGTRNLVIRDGERIALSRIKARIRSWSGVDVSLKPSLEVLARMISPDEIEKQIDGDPT